MKSILLAALVVLGSAIAINTTTQAATSEAPTIVQKQGFH